MIDRRGWWHGPATLDGLAGSGKSTVASLLASDVLPVLEVGQIYRRIAAMPNPREDWVTRAMEDFPATTDVELDRLLAVTQDPAIRSSVNHYQRSWADQHEQSILVGRVGGHLFPSAEVMVFLTVSPVEQSRRFGADAVHSAHRRDEADRTREHDPVRPAQGALVIDTSTLAPAQVVARIDESVRGRSRQWQS